MTGSPSIKTMTLYQHFININVKMDRFSLRNINNVLFKMPAMKHKKQHLF